MAEQRTRLAQYEGQTIHCRATIGEFTHKKIAGGGKGPVYLLKDLDLTDKKGHIVSPDISDHVWVNASKNFFKIGTELLPGDEILFTAMVSTYSIRRSDVMAKRTEVIQDAQQKNQHLFQDYREDYLDWKDDYAKVQEANQFARQRMQRGEIDRKTFQEIEQRNMENYKNAQPNGVSVKDKEQQTMRKAERQKHDHKLVDYQLINIVNVKLVNKKRLHRGWTRLKLTEKDLQRIKFTKYLAARSFAYRDGTPFDVFDRK